MSELKTLGKHASTVLVGQLAVMAFGVADTMIAGRYSDTALAALSVGSAIYISVYVALIGIVQALLPIWAELQGAKKYTEVGRSVRQALYIVLLTSIIGMAVLCFIAVAVLPMPLTQRQRMSLKYSRNTPATQKKGGGDSTRTLGGRAQKKSRLPI